MHYTELHDILGRYGSGVTLKVKIGSQDDFIGSVQESVLTRDVKSTDGSILSWPQSPRTQSPPSAEVVVATTTNNGQAVQNFMNFVENSFEHAQLVEQHLVS